MTYLDHPTADDCAPSLVPAKPSRAKPLEVRFWAKVHKADGDGCWVWTGALERNGYAHLRCPTLDTGEYKARLVHRVSWELHNGPIPAGLFVLHRCDNRACIRPDHLFLGTQMENIHDMMAKNRKPRFPGAKNGRRKLTEAEVLQIIERYRAGESGPSLAAEHGVTRQAIYNIISGQAWAETVAEYQAQRASEVSAEGIRMTPLPTTERRKGKSHHGQAPAPGSLSPRAAAIPGAGTIEQPVGGEQTR